MLPLQVQSVLEAGARLVGTLRIIGGEKRGFPLSFPRGSLLRPTSSRVREALFDILAAEVEGSRFLDLYAGSGAIGIEALSRGAAEALFVEEDPRNSLAIRHNLESTGLARSGSILKGRLPGCLSRLEGQSPFAIVFVDPPYGEKIAQNVLTHLGSGRLLGPASCVVVEHRKTLSLAGRFGVLHLRKTARYGDTSLSFYRLAPASR
jgi:16S rRNA (guanine966-N2)-methyltransferase